jgi:AcrR family transcriptional regulator
MNAVRAYDSTLRAEQMEQTRHRILEAVSDALADDTVEDLTIPAIARRARVSVRTVYRHFPTREALFDAWGDWAGENLRILMHQYPETLEELRELPASLFQAYDDNESLVRGVLNSKGARELRTRTRRRRRKQAEKALDEVTAELDSEDRRRASAVIYLLISAPAWQAMREQSGLSGAEAGEAAAWAVRVLTDELRRNPESIKASRGNQPTKQRRNGR